MNRIGSILLTFAALVVLTQCTNSYKGSCIERETEAVVLEDIDFAGYTWDVKSGYCSQGNTAGPGPNYWCGDEEDLWVDGSNRLHMKINYKSALSHYAAAEIYTPVAGCGRYTFKVAPGPNGTPDNFDKHVVLGLFTYKDDAANDNWENDIEISDWSVTSPTSNLYYVTWEDSSSYSHSTLATFGTDTVEHIFEWLPSGVSFQSTRNGTLLFDAIHVPPYSYSCPAFNVNVHMNLWLNEGTDPTSAQEVIIEDFEYEPLVILVAPTDVEAEMGGGSVELTWVDESSAEYGTEIERKTDVDGGTYSLLDTVDPDEEYYEDDTVNTELTYYYRLRSKDSYGYYSAYSSEAEASQEDPELDSLTDFSFNGANGYVEGTIQNMPSGSWHIRTWVETNAVYPQGKDLSPGANGYFYISGLWGSPGPTTYIWVTLHPAATDVYGTGNGDTIDSGDWPDEIQPNPPDVWVFGPFDTQ